MIAKRLEDISSFMVMDVLEKANEMEHQGIDVIHLEVGEPDFDVPECIKIAACQALEDGHTHYTHSLGMIELRNAICEHYDTFYNITIQPEQVMITSGTSPAMLSLFAVLLNPGDEVIISDPGYACYPNFIKFVQGIPTRVPVYAEDGFQYRSSAIRARLNARTKAIFINSPSNPTGNLLSEERLKEIAAMSTKGTYIISDEIYHGLVYEGREHSILEYTQQAFVLNGFSKLYAMTGLRLGYLIAPLEFIRPLQKIQQNFFISANSMAQMAGITALKHAGDDIARMKQVYNQRRCFMIQGLRQIGFEITVEPTGAFYVFANARRFSADSLKLTYEILENAHVGVTPGVDFGIHGEGYLRFSYANSLENIKIGLDRLGKYLHTRGS